jgi:tetratricopeptide (TPR) repeat protein
MDRQKNVADIFTQAMSEMLNKHFGTSIALLSEVLTQEPRHPLALIARGSAFMQQGNMHNAVADFDHAVQVNPNYARAYHLRGLARFQDGDEQGAMQDFNRAIELDPEYGAAYYSRANLHSKAGNEDAAAEDAATAAHLGTRNLERYGNEHNIIRTMHLAVEDAMETELER